MTKCERAYRDVRLGRIGEGTDEVQLDGELRGCDNPYSFKWFSKPHVYYPLDMTS